MRQINKYTLLFLLFSFSFGFANENLLDLNRATLEQIESLPIPKESAKDIYDYITYKKYLDSIYEIRYVNGMTQETFDKLKDLVKVEPVEYENEYTKRLVELQWLVERYTEEDGSRQNDEYLELLLKPTKLKDARYSELNRLSGVSPIDAAAVIKHVDKGIKVRNVRDLRNIEGLSNFGYRNTRNFIDFSEEEDNDFHLSYRTTISNLPYFSGDDEATTDIIGSTNNLDRPHVLHKLRFSKGNMKSGVAYHRRAGEDAGFSDGPTVKWYHGFEKIGNKDYELRKLYFGNYHISWGQGLVMENTDSFSSRSTGLGFRKRTDGVIGDLSSTDEFALKGMAFEGYIKNFRLLGFASLDKKDVVNDTKPGENAWDGYFISDSRNDLPFFDDNGIIVSDSLVVEKDQVKEFTYGGQIQYSFQPGINLGLSFYESQYNKELTPRIENLIRTSELDRVETIDNEIKNRYASKGANTVFGKNTAYRRIVGTDFQFVRGNYSFQGEVASLLDYRNTNGFENDTTKALGFKDSPKAVVLSSYIQYDTFNFLVLYRNYDRRFDNPYNRGFANYAGFKGTIAEDDFRVLNPNMLLLQENSYTPQAEEGMFFATRYQPSRRFVVSLNYDIWTRKPDFADNFRFVTNIEFRPTFNLRLRWRNKLQSRDASNGLSKNGFDNNENIFTARMLLSKRNQIELKYFISSIKFRSRPRLSNTTLTDNQGGGNSIFGNVGDNSEVLSFAVNHNFSEKLKLKLWAGIYRGFFWAFEDTHFGVFDGNGIRYRALLTSAITPNISMRLHYIVDHQLEIRNHEARDFNAIAPEGASSTGSDYFGDRVDKSPENVFFLQFDYNF